MTTEAVLGTLARLAGAEFTRILSRPVVRLKVAWRVRTRAHRASIGLSFRAIYGWLARQDVRDELNEGGLESVESAVGNLAWRIEGASRQDAIQVIEWVLDEYLRALSPQDGIAVSAGRTRRVVLDESAQIRSDISLIPNAISDRTMIFARDLLQLHPWRTSRAQELAQRWPAVRDLAHSLAGSSARGELLRSWIDNGLEVLADAPADAWTWLGELASDYGQADAAVVYFKAGIARGVPLADYWWARAALALGQEDHEEEMRTLLTESKGSHPLGQGLVALLDARYAAAEDSLSRWKPDNPTDVALRANLLASAAVGRGQIDSAIEVLVEAVQADASSSGAGLRAAEMILSRARFGGSISILGEYGRARTFALNARDARRCWNGDSVAATLVALTATVFTNDIEGARRLATPTPDGEATVSEALDPRLLAERATLAALTGDETTALGLLNSIENEHKRSMVLGWLAHDKGDAAKACDHWLTGWRAATNDPDRLQAASALAQLGGVMPDMSDLAARHPEMVKKIGTIHEVMSATGDRLSLLRARAFDSELLTMTLVAMLRDEGDLRGAADVLKEGARRWQHPLMLKMAAQQLLAAGDYQGALDCCANALQMAGHEWSGEFDTLAVMFEAEEALGRQDQALLTVRRMVVLAPLNLDARWVLVQCLVRNGDPADAWSALKLRGEPVGPRTLQEVRTWISLVSMFDLSDLFLSRALKVFEEWNSDEEAQGVILVNIYGRSRLHELESSDTEALQMATSQYLNAHPNSSVFRGLVRGDDDPLEALEAELRQRVPPPPLAEIEARIRSGELPLGLGAEAFHRSYTECAILRIAGLVFSDSDQLTSQGQQAAASAHGLAVVLDPTAAVTLARIDEPTAQVLVGSFSFIDSTAVAFRDALTAQESLAMRSTASIHWSPEAQKLVASQISDELADARARCADRVVALLRGARRVNWPRVEHLKELGEGSAWMSALDYAIESGEALWCDDYLLRTVALEMGVPAFSTVDLLRHVGRSGGLAPDMVRVTESVLIQNFHVDLGFDTEIMRLAATLDRWAIGGASAALTRPATWKDARAALVFLLEAVQENANRDPLAVQEWVQSAVQGLVQSAGPDLRGAYGNVRLLLTFVIGSTAQQRGLLPFVVAGTRAALSQYPGIDDPLGEVLEKIHSMLIERLDHSKAADFLLGMVSGANADDQCLAARIILTTPM
jgi:tetratricopeptide (TPR) repeat protein